MAFKKYFSHGVLVIMKKISAFALLLSITILPTIAQGASGEQNIAEVSVWKDRSGKAVPNTDSRASKNGFGGALVLTSDNNWKEKWSTPTGTTPRFNVAEKIDYGKKAVLLTFFTNPALGSDQSANILCDIKVTDPQGMVVSNKTDLICYQGKINGNLLNTYLAAPTIDFIGEEGDPSGQWTFEVTLKDQVRNVVLPLKTVLKLKPQ